MCDARLAYGWLAESIFPLFATMACCEVFSIVYVSVYLTLTPHRGYCIKVLLLALSGVVLVALYSALGLAGVTNQSRHSVATVVGIIADVGSLVMYLSPFETIVHVIKTKNASSMPIHLCLVGAIGNAVWVIYAILVSDLIVLIPNSICSTVGWIQVAIYFVYRPSRAVNAAGTVELDVPTKAQPPSPVIHATTYTAVRTPTADALA